MSQLGVICTGGTIGCRSKYDDGGEAVLADPAIVDELLDELGATARLDLVVRHPLHLCSEDIVPEDWLQIAAAVRSVIEGDDVDGVVVLHGTDTAAYTTAALSFL